MTPPSQKSLWAAAFEGLVVSVPAGAILLILGFPFPLYVGAFLGGVFAGRFLNPKLGAFAGALMGLLSFSIDVWVLPLLASFGLLPGSENVPEPTVEVLLIVLVLGLTFEIFTGSAGGLFGSYLTNKIKRREES